MSRLTDKARAFWSVPSTTKTYCIVLLVLWLTAAILNGVGLATLLASLMFAAGEFNSEIGSKP